MTADMDHAPTKRVIDILTFLAAGGEWRGQSEIARGVGSPVSTVAGILRTLRANNFLEYDPERRGYRLGFAAYAVAAGYVAGHSLFRCAVAEMHRVVEACSEICELGVLDGGNVLYLAKVESPDPIRIVSQVGARLPACCTATGKALLADCGMPELRRLYGERLPVVTPSSITDFDVLLGQLRAIHAGGVARARRESTREAEAFALPLRFRESIVAAITVSVPLFRMSPEKVAAVEGELRRAQRVVQALMEERGESLAPAAGS